MYIYVLDKDGKPLMPTTRAGRVRRMLRDGRISFILTFEGEKRLQDK